MESIPMYFVLNIYYFGNWLFGLRHPDARTYRQLGSAGSGCWRSEMLVTSWGCPHGWELPRMSATSIGSPEVGHATPATFLEVLQGQQISVLQKEYFLCKKAQDVEGGKEYK